MSTTAHVQAGAVTQPPERPEPGLRGQSRGWLGVAAMTALLAATWAPLLNARLGDNHYGRVHGRYALQVRNLQEHGLLGSQFSADWSPYSSTPYAHHPPLQSLLGALFSELPGAGEWQLRAGPYLLALLAVPGAAALLRGLGLRWGPTLLATGLLTSSGFFWIYGLLQYDLGIIMALSAAVVWLRNRPSPPRWLVCAAGLLALLAALGSWPSIVFAGTLWLWLMLGNRRLDQATTVVGAGTVIGLATSLTFMTGVHGIGGLLSQTEERTTGGAYTAVEFLSRQVHYLSELLPVWYLLLFPAGVIAGLADRRTRFLTLVSTVYAAGYVLVLNNGAYIHNYWGYLILIPGVVGMGALLDRLATMLPGKAARLGASVLTLLLAIGLATVIWGPAAREQLYRPTDAGRLVADHRPAPDQRYAWHGGLSAPRWLAYYWNREPRVATPERLASEAEAADLVVLDLSRLPDWLADSASPSPVARQGRYVLVRVDVLREAARSG